MRKLPSKSMTWKYWRNLFPMGFFVSLLFLGSGPSEVFSQSSPHGSLTIECTTCHTTDSWKDLAVPMKFNHDATSFPLQGQHVTTACRDCHTTLKFTGTTKDCFSCHQTDYIQSLNPNHQSGQFSHDCTTCHSMNSWKQSIFKHSVTSFPLLGAHQALPCISCHKNGRMAGTPTECFSCHQTDYAQTQSPNHLAAQFPHDCLTCHTMNGWQPATFNHSKGNFPLVGAHQALECSSCHKNNRYSAIPTDCWSCHQTDFTNVQSPNHLTGQFSHDCTTCHSMNGWKPSTFDHSKTNFVLTGAHLTTDCVFCHKNNQYSGLPTDCWSCHQTNYTNVADPNHVTGNFDHNCMTCHTTTAWNPATFDHSKVSFQLTGAHVQTPCVQCHKNGVFQGTPTICYTCHLTDYNNSTNPSHAGAQFLTDCVTCHTTIGWRPSTFDHSQYFPIAAGNVHSPGRWTFCSDCHINSTNFKQFSCVTCHQHSQSITDGHHTGVTGYVYDSAHCYSCHPRGTVG